jgi:hypothetical protein
MTPVVGRKLTAVAKPKTKPNPVVIEKQEWQFRQQNTPAYVCHLAQQGKVSLKDLLLMWTIDSLVKPQTDKEGSGCYASNEYLGEAAGCHPMHVSKRLQYLAEIGLVVIINYKNQRFLELEWSRVAKELAAMRGNYGIRLRNALKKLNKRVRGKPQSLGGEVSLKAYEGGKPQSLHKYYIKELKLSQPADAADNVRISPRSNDIPPHQKAKGQKVNGHHLNGQSKKQVNGHKTEAVSPVRERVLAVIEKKEQECAKSMASKLFDKCYAKGVLGVNKPRPDRPKEQTLKSWIKPALKIIQEVGTEHFRQRMNCYLEKFGREYIPQAYSMQSVVSKWEKIEALYHKTQKEEADGYEVDDTQDSW